MSLKWKFWEKKANDNNSKLPVKTVDIPSGSWLHWILGGTGMLTPTESMSFYRKTSCISTAVDLIAGAFEQITPSVYDKVEKKYIQMPEVDGLLAMPNPFQTYQQFVGSVARNYLITGNTQISAMGNVLYPPVELYSIKPQHINIQEDIRDGFPSTYFISTGAGNGVYTRVLDKNGLKFYDGNFKQLCHIMTYSSFNHSIQGDSPLNSAALEAKQLLQGKIHNLSLLDSGGRLSLVVAFKGEAPSAEEHAERKKRILEDLAGANGQKIAVISAEDIAINEVGTSNRDMDYANLQNIASLAVYLRYKIPLPLVSLDASTFNNFETAIEVLYDWAVLPLANVIFGGLSNMIFPRHKIDTSRYILSYDPESISALVTRRLNQLMTRKNIGVETINEMRKDIPGRDPIKGADDLYISTAMIPIGTPPQPFSTDINAAPPSQETNPPANEQTIDMMGNENA